MRIIWTRPWLRSKIEATNAEGKLLTGCALFPEIGCVVTALVFPIYLIAFLVRRIRRCFEPDPPL
jgi:hypothetical protein